jgi:hypothetical protein
MKEFNMSGWKILTITAISCLMAAPFAGRARAADEQWLVFDGKDGPGHGKQIVLLSGDEEYRSEEGLPQLAKILAHRHGFRCTVLFSINPKDGTIDPNEHSNTPGTEALKTADLLIMLTRFRNLPDEQMKPVADYIESGRPIMGLRTATHGFDIPGNSPYARYSYSSGVKGWDGGFGRHVLGETWINHWGGHKSESTRGIIAPGMAGHPILRGIKDGEIWCPTDVYEVRLPMLPDVKPLVLGQVLKGMKPDDPPVTGKKNEPMMPIAWIKPYTGTSGKTAQNFCTTMGASTDLENEALRRLLVNAAYWCVGLADKIPEKTNVDLVGEYKPLMFGFGGFKKGVKPADLKVE